MKGFAPGLALKQRGNATRKSPISFTVIVKKKHTQTNLICITTLTFQYSLVDNNHPVYIIITIQELILFYPNYFQEQKILHTRNLSSTRPSFQEELVGKPGMPTPEDLAGSVACTFCKISKGTWQHVTSKGSYCLILYLPNCGPSY